MIVYMNEEDIPFFDIDIDDETLDDLKELACKESYDNLNDFILYIISSHIDARDAQMRDGKVAIELTGFDLDVVKEIAEETECADLSECVYDMIQAAIKERNETHIIISLPNHLISLIDESVDKGKYESRSQMINFILRGYFGTIGKILR